MKQRGPFHDGKCKGLTPASAAEACKHPHAVRHVREHVQSVEVRSPLWLRGTLVPVSSAWRWWWWWWCGGCVPSASAGVVALMAGWYFWCQYSQFRRSVPPPGTRERDIDFRLHDLFTAVCGMVVILPVGPRGKVLTQKGVCGDHRESTWCEV